MTSRPSLRGIPFYSGIATDNSNFAPIYAPQAVRFARRVNFLISTIIGIAFLGLIALLFSTPALSSTADSESVAVRIVFNFALPIFLCMIGVLLIIILTPRIGFDLPQVYSATADGLRAWLPSAAGDYPSPKENLLEEIKDNFSTADNSIRFMLEADGNSLLYEAAKIIACQSPEDCMLFSNDGRVSILQLDTTGRYQLM